MKHRLTIPLSAFVLILLSPQIGSGEVSNLQDLSELRPITTDQKTGAIALFSAEQTWRGRDYATNNSGMDATAPRRGHDRATH